MAVTLNKNKTALVLVVSDGVDATGAPARKTIRFTTVRPAIADDALHDIGGTFAGMMDCQLFAMRREDSGDLVNS